MTTTQIPEELQTCCCGGRFTLSDLFGHDCPVADPASAKLSGSYSSVDAALASVDRPAGWTGGPKNTRTAPADLASPPQLAYIAKLGGTPDPSMSKRSASRLIDSLLDGQASAAVATPAQAPVRSNRFAGPCAACHQDVPAETGTLTSEGGRWVVRHVGPCPAVETPTASPTPSGPSVDVPDGYYAIVSTGDNDLAFYRVKHSDRWGVSVSLVVGGHSDQFVRRAAVAGILSRIADDPEAAKRYADEIGCCYRCNRTLTDEESRRLGIGPTCRSLA